MPLHTISAHEEISAVDQSRQAGFTMVEAVLSLSLMAVMAVGIGEAINRNSNNIGLANVASQMSELRAATDRYVQDNFMSLSSAAAGGPIEIPISTLANGNYLPPSFNSTNLYQQTYHVYLRERSSSVLESMVAPTGGRALSITEGGNIALLLKGVGGYVPQGSGNAVGSRGAWNLSLASIVPGSSPRPSGAAVAYQIHYSVYGPTGALIRYATGNPLDNQMAATLNMNGNAISNTGTITGSQFVSNGSANGPSVIANTPNIGSTGGIQLQGNPSTGVAYFQVTDKDAHAQWGYAAITPDGLWNWSGTINAANLLINGQPIGGIPAGVIVAFSGACPSGWSEYGGARDRVIVGAGGSYSTGQTGGSDSVALSVNQMPSHSHGEFSNQASNSNISSASQAPAVGTNAAGDKYFNYSITGAGNAASTGNWIGQTQYVGGGQPFDNRQQFVALNYCQKN
ncbi:shufflon system plasmid conjugative transfer pilus tip adhesin PilV [Novosphingobium terrae]|uniref:shufflon system plasmid conjugative transfer pilus tip adhesin PilV n=1 Tax=Novosphingobium terrae TaxID=2726189 RepID=UPI0019807930|nr:shufflon system plasmid conjugative transfer pilus tip adhesin PilV [Novosphingobium terrae]